MGGGGGGGIYFIDFKNFIVKISVGETIWI